MEKIGMSEAEKFIGRYEQDILSRVYLPKAIKGEVPVNSMFESRG